MAPFDPYHIWLEIPSDEQPPTPHRLLGIAPDETDKEIIREAALQRNALIRQYSLGEQGKMAERLLNEIAAARDNILAGNVQTAVETPSPAETPFEPDVEKSVTAAAASASPPVAETPIEPVVEKADPFAGTPVTPPLVADRGPLPQQETQPIVVGWSTFKTAEEPQIKAQKERGRRVLSVVGVIGVLALFISMMLSDHADHVLRNSDEPLLRRTVSPPPVPPTAPATESITNSIGMKLNLIPAGTFMMGSPETEKDRQDDEDQHMVTISKAFYMQTTEVTQSQWKALMGTEPWKGQSYVKEGPNYPASCVSWNEAFEYCKKLSEQERKTYRLPTEAEWEYACRAGTKTTWSFGNDEGDLGDYAWYKENANYNFDEEYAHQVGLKKPNAFGLYDMNGNASEWCHDHYGEDYYRLKPKLERLSPQKDPTGPTNSAILSTPGFYGGRVLRGGGSWGFGTGGTRSADRGRSVAGNRSGFRLVRELD